MLKIAFVNTEYLPIPPIKGGAVEEWVEKVSHLLREDVFVFSISHPSLPLEHQRGRVRYFHFRNNWLLKILLISYKLPFKKDTSFLYYLPYSFWCAWKLRRIKPDIIHIHNRPQFVPVMKLLNPKSKIILHFHQLSAMDESNLWTKKFIDSVDLFIGISVFVVEKMRQRYPEVPESKTDIVPNGIDIGSIRPNWELNASLTQEQKTILYVGRLAENKGVHVLLEAFLQILKKGETDICLIICGAAGYSRNEVTPYVKRLQYMAKEAGDKVVFSGYVPHEKMVDHYRASDLVVIPSLVEEGFCVVAIEAMAYGVPVIAFAKGGLKEIISDKVDGRLLEEESVESLQKTMEEFLANEKIYQDYAHHARLKVEQKFTWNDAAASLTKNYSTLIAHD